MKILQVNVVANAGSTGKITTEIHESLITNGHESLVCYGAGMTVRKSAGYYRICSNIGRQMSMLIRRLHGVSHGYYAWLSTRRLIRKIITYKPDIVHLQCINGGIVDIFKLLSFLGDNEIKTIITQHAEFLYTGTCGVAYDCDKCFNDPGCGDCPIYKSEVHSIFDKTRFSWRQTAKAFSTFEKSKIVLASVSPWLKARSMMSPITGVFKNVVVLNGVDDNIFKLRHVSDRIKQKFDPSKKIILYVTAAFDQRREHLKGGWYVLELARKMPNCQFCIVAYYMSDIDNLPENVILWGRASSQNELAELYNVADLTVLTSKRETFSMVVAESLCCGTPVVGFEAGGPESIALKEYAKFVEYGNLELLEKSVAQTLMEEFDHNLVSRSAHMVYSKDVMTQNYMKLYKSIL